MIQDSRNPTDIALTCGGIESNRLGQLLGSAQANHHKEEQDQDPHLKVDARNLLNFGFGQNIEYLLDFIHINGNLFFDLSSLAEDTSGLTDPFQLISEVRRLAETH